MILALLFGKEKAPGRHVGSIDPNCRVVDVIQDAYANAKFLCDQYYLASPELVIEEHNGNGGTLTFLLRRAAERFMTLICFRRITSWRTYSNYLCSISFVSHVL